MTYQILYCLEILSNMITTTLFGLLVFTECLITVQSKNSTKFFDCVNAFDGSNPMFYYNQWRPNINPNLQELCQDGAKETGSRATFATLYDTNLRSPMFSAYVLENYDSSPRRSNNWFKERNLDNDKQAVPNDYIGLSSLGLDRGHLAPFSYFRRNPTFSNSLTNVVPQYSGFNRGKWCNVEQTSKNKMKESCGEEGDKAYFITGVIPGRTSTAEAMGKKGKLKDINIPSYLYTAACCRKNKGKHFSFGYLAENSQNRPRNVLNPKPLAQLANEISRLLKSVVRTSPPNFQFFHDNCGEFSHEKGKCDNTCDVPCEPPSKKRKRS